MKADALTLSEVMVPARGISRDVALVGSFAGLTALAAQVTIYLPFTPVPISGQTFAVLLCGAVLGRRRGAAAQLFYIGLGSIGLPVFAGGGSGLPAGPSGGYIVGFVVAAYLVGLMAERGWDRRVSTACLAMLAGNITIYAFGLPWLACFVGGPPVKVLALGLYPFIAGDFMKLALASALLPSTWRLIGGRSHSEGGQ